MRKETALNQLLKQFALPLKFGWGQGKVLTLSRNCGLSFTTENVEEKFLDSGRNWSVERTVKLKENAASQRIGAVSNPLFIIKR